MNPRLSLLQPYPFERLRTLLAGATPPALPAIRLSIGEPQHATPNLVRRALADNLDGLGVYPTTAGSEELRRTLAVWFQRRYGLASLDPGSDVLPVLGTREALFAFAQAVIDPSRPSPLVVCPNPFYQIYEGAALLAGARPIFLDQTPADGFALRLDAIAEEDWRRVQLVYVCSPGNPTGRVLTLDDWRALFAHADRYGFTIASDECYSEIYPDEAAPPLGGLEACRRLARERFRRLVVFSSLSKRSNAPGLRSGAVAGDADLLRAFLLYRTYHGSAMSLAVQRASIAAWCDEDHVRENRARYREKFEAVTPILAPVLSTRQPDAGFYLWAQVPGGDDERFVRELYEATHVTVLPGTYLGRPATTLGTSGLSTSREGATEDDAAEKTNPGRGFVRIALVPALADCLDAARRIAAFCR